MASEKFKSSLGIQRFKMPQIKEPDLESFVSWLEKKNIFVKRTTIKVSDLLPTQDNYNPDKVESMKSLSLDKLRANVIVSSDNYILDGHHRYQTLMTIDKNETMIVTKVNLSIDELLDYAGEFPKSFTQGINEANKIKLIPFAEYFK